MALADVEGARIHLKQLTIAHQITSWESFQEILVGHYTRQILHEIYKVRTGKMSFLHLVFSFPRALILFPIFLLDVFLQCTITCFSLFITQVFGSAGVIGNPMGFARNVAFGIKDFLSAPSRSISKVMIKISFCCLTFSCNVWFSHF